MGRLDRCSYDRLLTIHVRRHSRLEGSVRLASAMGRERTHPREAPRRHSVSAALLPRIVNSDGYPTFVGQTKTRSISAVSQYSITLTARSPRISKIQQ